MTTIADLLELHGDGARAGSGWWPATAPWSSATRRSRSCTRRPSTPGAAVAAVLEHHPNALVAVEERGRRATGSTGTSPTGELSGEMTLTDVEELVAGAGQPGDHPRPRRHRRGLRRARPPSSACTAPTTSSAGPPGSTSRRSGSPRPPASRCVADAARPRRRRRAGDRRRPQRHRDAPLGRPRGGHGPGGRGGARRRRRRRPRASSTTAPPSSSTAGSASSGAPGDRLPADRWPPSGCGCRCGPPRSAPTCVAGRHRPHWHPDYPRAGRPRRRDHVARRRPVGAAARRARPRPCRRLDRLLRPAQAPARRRRPEAEVGYGLVAEARGCGVATEALRGAARRDRPAGVRVRASVRPDNAASIRVLAKCGFTELRGANEDGELVMARPLPVTARARCPPRPAWSPPTSTARWSAPTAPSRTTPATCCSSWTRRGVPVVFVTGRPLRWAEEVFEYVGAHGLAVVSNGALVWDVARAPGRTSSGRSTPALGLEVCAADPRGGARARRSRSRRCAGIAPRAGVPRAAPGARRQPGAAPIEELFDEPALKLLRPARGARRRRSSGTPPRPRSAAGS